MISRLLERRQEEQGGHEHRSTQMSRAAHRAREQQMEPGSKQMSRAANRDSSQKIELPL